VAQLQAREEQKRASREDLISVHTREEEVPLASLDGATVVIRSLTARQRRELRDRAGWQSDDWDEERFTALCVVASLVDPVLTEDDIESLMDQEASLWDELTLSVSLINLPSPKMGVKDLGKDSSPTES
jgi:hypothetical protein